jgi:hypothetical protein
MKRKKYLLPLFLLLVVVWLGAALVSAVTAGSDDFGDCPDAAAVLQRGKVIINIPAGANTASEIVQVFPCAGMNVQASGGSMLNTPIVINAIVHQDSLILTANLIKSQPGPVDVVVWWRVD